MLKVVIVTPAAHFSNPGAVQHDIYAAIEFFQGASYEVVLYTVDSTKQDSKILEHVAQKYGISVKKYMPRANFFTRLKAVLLNPVLIDGSAFVFCELTKSQEFTTFFAEFKPNLIFSFCSYSYPVIQFAQKNNIKSVFRSHNFEPTFYWESLRLIEKCNPLNWLRAAAKYFAEYRAVTTSSAVATLPFSGVSHYKRWRSAGVEILTLLFLPKAVRPPHINTNKSALDVFYLGASYNVVFHLRGAEVLINEIAPEVEKLAPGAFKFHICGGKLPERLRNNLSKNTVYEGYVPNLDSFLENMDIGVFPVFTGTTMKGKVFESLARSFPVIMTTNCLGGYNLTNAKEAYLADTTAEFIGSLLKLQDPIERERLARGANAFAEQELSSKALTKSFQSILKFVNT